MASSSVTDVRSMMASSSVTDKRELEFLPLPGSKE